jgi:glyoxylase-like metal-dependent hydrolase (beta-lactamase superfamily II)
MGSWRFTRGVHDLGNGAYAYLQPSGTWGYSNAGLVADGDEALLIDTLFDERLTADMLRALKEASGFGADEIATVVNTHANGDHTFGNRLARKATIIASTATAREMSQDAGPELLAELMRNTETMGEVGAFFRRVFGAFDFAGVSLRLPDRTFSGEELLRVGDKQVRLIEVGPAHTGGDVLVHVPSDRVVFTGDILFVDSAPIAWSGPVKNWIAACDRIREMDVETIVPGHGPITDNAGVTAMQDYLAYVDREARKRHAAGLSAWEAAEDIALDSAVSWRDGERIAVTVDTIYREIAGDDSPRDVLELFTRMVRLEHRFRAAGPAPAASKGGQWS